MHQDVNQNVLSSKSMISVVYQTYHTYPEGLIFNYIVGLGYPHT